MTTRNYVDPKEVRYLIEMLIDYDDKCRDGLRLRDRGETHVHWCTDMDLMVLRDKSATALRLLLEEYEKQPSV